ncbi:hypothetical protein [Pseudoruegeria sp. HB172150]|uniref:hypothetical protein n=1 Tax=Pseudoruegeria sp. HB172150 TaxID=2721164 RepID=UPI001556FF7A|nr:hypothetical protein [Pseudoruegeria sp. HB172150]
MARGFTIFAGFVALPLLSTATLGIVFGRSPEAQGAAAQATGCDLHDDIAATLSGQFGEAVRFSGRGEQTGRLELWLSDAGTWSVSVSGSDGITCMLAAGIDGSLMPAPGKAGWRK